MDRSIHSLRLIQSRVTRGHRPIPVAIWQIGVHPGQGCLSIAGLKRNYELMTDNITKYNRFLVSGQWSHTCDVYWAH